MDPVSIPKEVVVWKFGGKTGNLTAQHRYSTDNAGNGLNMFCKTNNGYLTYHKTDIGINLGYITSPKEHKIHFALPDGKDREILTGEKVALGIGGGDAFLRYAHRTSGINLEWASSPSFEWQIYGPTSEKGKKIPLDSFVAVLNERVEPAADFLVYLDRPIGADVGWTTSPNWKDKITGWITNEAFSALIGVLMGKAKTPA
ncbi:hypothetical protein GO988_00320 [Hymenobacter sp. HMF4947]|uniref:Uncharacterized protein n=1 Tax=Hymenobacter ginkgonis TaxID=2682976 RepID=A0A7K1T8Q0_9BACT|nr:hypothetical protein [Hymenobacter ginkgonis]MVN74763.1 hypothetical protein [Hymenobacter ginkgonis]